MHPKIKTVATTKLLLFILKINRKKKEINVLTFKLLSKSKFKMCAPATSGGNSNLSVSAAI